METKQKFYPEVGTPLYLSQRTGDYYVDLVKVPYTVVGINRGRIIIQSANCIFPKNSHFNTLPSYIIPDDEGEILELSWSRKKGMWQNDKYQTGYPYYAYFGKYEYYPYLN